MPRNFPAPLFFTAMKTIGPFAVLIALLLCAGCIAEDACNRASVKQRAADVGQHGVLRAESGDLDAAFIDFNHALELDPKNADLYYSRGTAKFTKGDLDGAIADCTSAIELDPKNSDAYFERGYAMYAKGEYDRAITDYLQVLALDTKNSEARNAIIYVFRGLAKRAKQDSIGALADFREGAKLGEIYAAFWSFLTQTESDQRDNGSKELGAALDRFRKPGADEWSLQVGNFLLGRTAFAAFLAQAPAIKNDYFQRGQTCQVWYYQGMLQKFTGQRAEAMDSFRKTIATERKDAVEYHEAIRELKALEAGAKEEAALDWFGVALRVSAGIDSPSLVPRSRDGFGALSNFGRDSHATPDSAAIRAAGAPRLHG